MEFMILGPVEARAGDRVLDLGGPKARALLAALLLHANRAVSAERLAMDLWGEEGSTRMLPTLRVSVSRLRRSLAEADRLATIPGGYVLHVGDEELDVLGFRRLVESARGHLSRSEYDAAASELRAALGLWRGPPLADVATTPFAGSAITHLEEERADALELRIDADLQLGRAAALIGELRQLVAENPWRERHHAQLMLALYRAGRAADALDAYRDARSVLDEQLGIEPGPELRRLEGEILRHDETLAAPAALEIDVPRPATATIGREREIAASAAVLRRDRPRLLTLAGPGGVGKTRLAMEVAHEVGQTFRDGARFAGLAPVARAEHVAAAIADAVGAARTASETFEEAVRRHLARKELLLVLDNFEHVLGAAPLVAELLAAAPRLRVLVTSRRPLHVAAEEVLPVGPLEPEPAIALFLERARAGGRAIGLEEAEPPAVRELCARLDGLPLAIELAAARASVLSPRGMLRRLESRGDVLGAAAVDAPGRQRTLWATIDWSHELLDAGQQRLLAELSVFAGGCTLEAAEQVCGVERPLDGVAALVDHSLVVSGADADGGTRLTMLDTIAAFAAERLVQRAEHGDVSRRHAEYFAALVERLEPELRASRDSRTLNRLETEMDNLRAALGWAGASGRSDLVLRIAAAVYLFWIFRGHHSEGVAWLDAAIASAAPDAPERIKAVRGRAILRASLGRAADALGDARELSAAARDADDLELRTHLLDAVGFVRQCTGDYAAARRIHEEVARLSREAGMPRQLCITLNNLCDIALTDGRFDDAVALATEATEVARAEGNLERMAVAQGNLASALLSLGRTEDASRGYAASFELARAFGLPDGLAYTLDGLGAVAAEVGDFELAARILGAADAVFEATGSVLQPFEARRRERVSGRLQDELGAREHAGVYAEGRRLAPEDAFALFRDAAVRG